jgi:protein-tyrosine phosphatase
VTDGEALIDIHTHVLPGLDDGPETADESLELARAAAESGTQVMVATPHVRSDYDFPLEEIARRTATLNRSLEDLEVPLRVVAGGEVSVARVAELDDAELRTVCLGDGPYILVESPYTTIGGLLETTLFGLQARGFTTVLAHPERSPSFQEEPQRLVNLVRKGALCSITSASISGVFGRAVRKYTLELFRGGLVHNVASDAHNVRRRPPDMGPGLRELRSALPRVTPQLDWLTGETPAAILAGRGVPARPKQAPRWRLSLHTPLVRSVPTAD